jgi:protein gp37
MNKTGIGYLDYTWNPTHGCSHSGSPGCDNCWAKAMAKRLAAMGKRGYDPADPFKVVCDSSRLIEPLKQKKLARISPCFMGDLFHDDVPFEFIDQVFAVMALCPQHTFPVLTKRAARMRDYFSGRPAMQEYRNATIFARAYELAEEQDCIPDMDSWRKAYVRGWSKFRWPLPNVHLGVSASTQEDLNRNVRELLKCPAAHYWLSVEPLLEEVNVEGPLISCVDCGNRGSVAYARETFGRSLCRDACVKRGEGPSLNQVVVGCESGPKRRPCKLEWIESIVDQCDAAGVPCYVKQMEIGCGEGSGDTSYEMRGVFRRYGRCSHGLLCAEILASLPRLERRDGGGETNARRKYDALHAVAMAGTNGQNPRGAR